MSELTNLRGLGALLGAAVGAGLGVVLALIVVFATPAFGIRWPVAPATVLLGAAGLPIVLTAFAGALSGPSLPGLVRRASVALATDPAVLDATSTDTTRPFGLHISRGFTAIYLVPAFVMTAFAVVLIVVVAPSTGLEATLAGWADLLFFGAITVMCLVQFIWPTRFGLALDGEGFTVTMNLGRRRYRWVDVEKFFPYSTVAFQPVVAFKYRGKAEVHGLQYTRGIGVFGAFDGTLPQNLSIRGLALLDLMERWRSRNVSTLDNAS
jgi:hypothetical protein